MLPISYYIIFSLVLFAIGMTGVAIRRNAIIIFMCIELMLNSVNLLLVAFSKMHYMKNPELQNGTDAQLLVFFIMVVAAAEVAVGLSVIILLFRKLYSVDINVLNRLKG
ncbi:NADH-quinone oxidoreductase subunit NuoK [Faecalibacter macacae]|uniref:NADH-quinone oxidoreductase subunit K n=1 Tax=Faecalibacter macacae TaxID=1859289 RepID=A0A3L9MF76_9FLAO|nr:NADH-quinone oxidoreductase subunit NuoK [Faecalibacter macacae]RLZ11667.1 NADH-quinone oxidoreductase subunit NuoK [Faecalibacter macacae]